VSFQDGVEKFGSHESLGSIDYEISAVLLLTDELSALDLQLVNNDEEYDEANGYGKDD